MATTKTEQDFDDMSFFGEVHAPAGALIPGDDLPPISPMKHGNRTITDADIRRSAAQSGAKIKPSIPGFAEPPTAALKKTRFRLDGKFKSHLRSLPEPWRGRGPNGSDDVVAQIVYERTYMRENECWADTIIRVTEGVYNMQFRHFMNSQIPWSFRKAQVSAQRMATLMFEMKFLPPGRGLWAMGTPLVEERGMYAALQNCAFVSTSRMNQHPTSPFEFCMDLSMLGVGVGFDTRGAQCELPVYQPYGDLEEAGTFDVYVVADSRDGWLRSMSVLLSSYFFPKQRVVAFDYSKIRPAGTPLKGFGGVASGPEPLMRMHVSMRAKLASYAKEKSKIDSTLITDIMNLIGTCVVAGNIRRSAEIAFGSMFDKIFIDLKNYDIHPERAAYGWASNNSVFAPVGADYTDLVDRLVRNGEPGIAWLDNMRKFGRMSDPPSFADQHACGANPCAEMTLFDRELCTLVETFIANHSSLQEYLETLKYAFIYAKTVTLAPIHRPESNKVMMNNRRIGVSQTGIAQFLMKHQLDVLRQWCDAGYAFLTEYDSRISTMFGIPKSIKLTTVKPSGTVSLLAGSTPGMHFPVAQHYIRRIQMGRNSHLIPKLMAAGYHIEPRVNSVDPVTKKHELDPETVVVSIPVSLGTGAIKTEANVTMWEQFELVAFLQAHWADNQVSCTVKFDPVTEGPSLKSALEFYQYRLKSISFLPKGELLDFPQLPYEPIDYETYVSMSKHLRPLDQTVGTASAAPPALSATSSCDDDDEDILVHSVPDGLAFCDGDHCQRTIRSEWKP